LIQLRDDGAYDTGCAISATIGADDTLGHVEGIFEPDGDPGPKLRAAQAAGLRRVIVVRMDHEGLTPAGHHRLKSAGLEGLPADRADEARVLASGLATELARYFALLETLPDQPEDRPVYFPKDRTRTALYVEPDLLRRERRAMLLGEGSHGKGRASGTEPGP